MPTANNRTLTTKKFKQLILHDPRFAPGAKPADFLPTGRKPKVATPVIVKVGTKITLTVKASDPENGILQYKFITPDGNATEWSSSNSWTWNVDAASYGTNKGVMIFVRDSDGYDYYGSGQGDDYT